ncbi:MAG TPA: transposase [Terrimicrobiaceae bacterium]|nr:transposase [Terrimicrobiaceae bacterium]
MTPGRRALPHQLPWSIDPSREIFFLTVCAQDRASGPLLSIASELLKAIRFFHDRGKWWVHLAVIMPDHVHLLTGFPPDRRFVEIVRQWKRWTAVQLRVNWQQDFFDHRVRREENLREKSDYILSNPVRAGLAVSPEDWPYTWIADGFLGRER